MELLVVGYNTAKGCQFRALVEFKTDNRQSVAVNELADRPRSGDAKINAATVRPGNVTLDCHRLTVQANLFSLANPSYSFSPS